MTESATKEAGPIPAEIEQRVQTLSAEFIDSADAMVALLTAHNETKWAENFGRLTSKMRQATTQSERRDATQYLRSFFGGMGSWNDFYLTALGEAEAERERLTGHLSRTGEALFELVTQYPDPKTPSFWSRLFGR